MLVCEAAGFDVIIIETVGVGQSGPRWPGMTDIFCLLQLPNAGDDLQAIKKGIMEIADLIVINKADINPQAANVARSQIKSALGMLCHSSPNWTPPVLMLSALQKGRRRNSGIPLDYRSTMKAERRVRRAPAPTGAGVDGNSLTRACGPGLQATPRFNRICPVCRRP